MGAKHTPGPWRLCGAFGMQSLIEPATGGHPVAAVTGYYHHAGNTEANAHLIAAAPDMLAALQDAKNSLVAFKFMPGPGNAWEDSDEANLQAVDAAIAKAAGGAA